MQVQRLALSRKSKQFILREVEAVVYPQDLSYLIAGKDLTGEVSNNFFVKIYKLQMIDAMLKIFAIDATRKVTTILFYHLFF